MATLQELIDQKAALDRQIAALQSEGRSKAIADIKSLMSEHGLTVDDLAAASSPARKVSKASGNKVAAKYRDTTTGATWTGRGLKPKWLSQALADGKKIEDFSV